MPYAVLTNTNIKVSPNMKGTEIGIPKQKFWVYDI